MTGTSFATSESEIITDKSILSDSQFESPQQELPQAIKEDGAYRNPIKFELFKVGKTFGMLKRWIFEKKVNSTPSTPVPIKHITIAELQPLAEIEVEITRLGHSSVLFRNASSDWLIDPVFSVRASPVQWAGPKRFHKVPLDWENFSYIEGILISHDHYDHLDKATILALHEKVSYFAVPMGVGGILIDWGVDPLKITEFTWWESHTIGSLKLTAAPAQHFSGRGLFNTMQTLWCGWAIESKQTKIYYTGDSGYFETFKTIGNELGPFDIALVETGAYDRDWPEVHMSPTKSHQAFLDLKAEVLLPVHNGTFDLAFHSWDDPFKQLSAIAQKNGTQLTTPRMGESILVHSIQETAEWWKQDSTFISIR